MKKILIFLTLSVVTIFASQLVCAGVTTVNTFYPSPTGIYNKIRLVPYSYGTHPPANCTAGTLYVGYETATGPIKLYMCTATAVRDIFGPWDLSGNNVVLHNNTWNVGVGTNNPTEKLTVAGAIASTRTGGSAGEAIFIVGNDGELWDVNLANTVGIIGQQDATKGAIKLGSTGPRLFGTSGRLGIGVTNPHSALEVDGGIRANKGKPTVAINNASQYGYSFDGDGDTGFFSGLDGVGQVDGGSNLMIMRDSEEVITIMRTSQQTRVGIGDSTPSTKLDVNGGIHSTGEISAAGEIKVGNSSNDVCDATRAGTMRYNSSIRAMEYCDSTAWRKIGPQIAKGMSQVVHGTIVNMPAYPDGTLGVFGTECVVSVNPKDVDFDDYTSRSDQKEMHIFPEAVSNPNQAKINCRFRWDDDGSRSSNDKDCVVGIICVK